MWEFEGSTSSYLLKSDSDPAGRYVSVIDDFHWDEDVLSRDVAALVQLGPDGNLPQWN